MDPQTDLPDLVEDLEVNIDELPSTLTPLLPPLILNLRPRIRRRRWGVPTLPAFASVFLVAGGFSVCRAAC